MAAEYGDIINDWVLRIARERHDVIEEALRTLPPGLVLCVHDGVGSLDVERSGDGSETHRFTFATHAIADAEACEWRGRREVYVPKNEVQ